MRKSLSRVPVDDDGGGGWEQVALERESGRELEKDGATGQRAPSFVRVFYSVAASVGKALARYEGGEGGWEGWSIPWQC